MQQLWICVSTDEYELPIAVADTQEELAEMIGVKKESIRTLYSKWLSGRIKSCRYRKVEIDDSIL